MSASEWMRRPWNTIVIPDQLVDGSVVYVAYHPELPGCMSQGSSPQEAEENLRDARQLYLESLERSGRSPEVVENRTVTGGYVALMTLIQGIDENCEGGGRRLVRGPEAVDYAGPVLSSSSA